MKFVENAALLGLGLIHGNKACWTLCAVCLKSMLRRSLLRIASLGEEPAH